MSDINATSYQGSAAVTKSDTTGDPAGPFAGLLVTVTGTVKLTMTDGSTVALLTNLAANVVLPFQVTRVWSTGTTATVIGLYGVPLKAPLNPGAGPGGAP